MSTRILLTALLTVALTVPVVAQTDAPPAAPATPVAQPAAAPVAAPAAAPVAAPAEAPAAAPVAAHPAAGENAAPASAVDRNKDTLSVDFPDEDIKTILRNVADLFELNLVVPDTVVGKTTIKMHDVTWRQIFQNVLAPIKFTYVEDGNIIKIVSNETLLDEPGTTEVFILNNAKALDIKPTIDGLVDAAKGGKIVIDARSNSLIITERPSRMSRIRGIVEQLDKATDQVMIESKFVEVTDRDIRNIGVNWASLSGVTLGVTNINKAYLKSDSKDWSEGETGSLTNSLATGGTATTSNTTTTPTGTQTTSSSIVTGPTDTVSGAITALNSLASAGGTSRLASAVFSASDFNVIVSALNSQNNTKIVSNPTVVTLNNSEAVINVGQEFPIPSYTYNSERGVFEVSGFTYKPIGIILKVTPQVNSQGIIKLALEPEVSQRNGDTSFNGATIPIIATRKAKTQVSLKDGYTMGIGGLIAASTNHGGTKVPVIGSIPVLGRLFSSKSVNDEATNLLIFITAKTVTSDGAAPEEVFDPRAIKAVGMSHEDLPGNRAPKGSNLFAPASASEKVE